MLRVPHCRRGFAWSLLVLFLTLTLGGDARAQQTIFATDRLGVGWFGVGHSAATGSLHHLGGRRRHLSCQWRTENRFRIDVRQIRAQSAARARRRLRPAGEGLSCRARHPFSAAPCGCWARPARSSRRTRGRSRWSCCSCPGAPAITLWPAKALKTLNDLRRDGSKVRIVCQQGGPARRLAVRFLGRRADQERRDRSRLGAGLDRPQRAGREVSQR